MLGNLKGCSCNLSKNRILIEFGSLHIPLNIGDYVIIDYSNEQIIFMDKKKNITLCPSEKSYSSIKEAYIVEQLNSKGTIKEIEQFMRGYSITGAIRTDVEYTPVITDYGKAGITELREGDILYPKYDSTGIIGKSFIVCRSAREFFSKYSSFKF